MQTSTSAADERPTFTVSFPGLRWVGQWGQRLLATAGMLALSLPFVVVKSCNGSTEVLTGFHVHEASKESWTLLLVMAVFAIVLLKPWRAVRWSGGRPQELAHAGTLGAFLGLMVLVSVILPGISAERVLVGFVVHAACFGLLYLYVAGAGLMRVPALLRQPPRWWALLLAFGVLLAPNVPMVLAGEVEGGVLLTCAVVDLFIGLPIAFAILGASASRRWTAWGGPGLVLLCWMGTWGALSLAVLS